MLFQKFLLLGLPVLALAASTTTEKEEEDELTTTTKSSSTKSSSTKTTTTSSGFKSVTTTTSSSSSKATDDEEEEEEEDKVTITTTSKGAKVTTVVSASNAKNSTSKNGSWQFDSFGEFITELPNCSRTCFETPIMSNVTSNCAKLDNWNCVCHFYKPSFYEKVFNDTIPATTTTKTSSTRKSTKTSTATTTTGGAEETEAALTNEEIAQDEFFTCLDEVCGVKEWGNGRNQFFGSIEKLNTYCNTEEKTYDEARNKKDYADIKAAEEALKKKKADEEAKKNKKSDAGKLGMGIWAVTAVAGFAVAFAL